MKLEEVSHMEEAKLNYEPDFNICQTKANKTWLL